jgi:hypothetical protein
MCDCDFTQPEFFTSQIRKARKEHTCCECGSKINPGDNYYFYSGKWEDNISSYKTCNDCQELAKEALECYGLGEMYDSLWECEIITHEEREDEDIVISLDERVDVVSQYPNLKVKLKG